MAESKLNEEKGDEVFKKVGLEYFLECEETILKQSLEQFKEEVSAYNLFEIVISELPKSVEKLSDHEKDILVGFLI
ncbi:MAG: hypothetical protein HY351_00630, partial [Candidatus Omnitrophica bacterium]|nr:hypothetical protein [Candidatus Omnitrophota bacterium]